VAGWEPEFRGFGERGWVRCREGRRSWCGRRWGAGKGGDRGRFAGGYPPLSAMETGRRRVPGWRAAGQVAGAGSRRSSRQRTGGECVKADGQRASERAGDRLDGRVTGWTGDRPGRRE